MKISTSIDSSIKWGYIPQGGNVISFVIKAGLNILKIHMF